MRHRPEFRRRRSAGRPRWRAFAVSGIHMALKRAFHLGKEGMTMRKQKAWALLLAVLLISLGGCARQEEASEPSSQETLSEQTETVNLSAETKEGIDTSFSSRDLDMGYEESTASKINLNGNQVSIQGNGASYSDGIITISSEGTYLLSGTLDNGRIVVNVPDTQKVQLVLKGADIYCEDNAAIFVQQADKVFITLDSGTQNTLSSGSSYNLGEDDSNVDGVVFSRADLTFNGTGKLTIDAQYQHAVVSKDDLVITGGEYVITAAGGGLYGKDCVKIADGTFTIDSGTDCIQSSNAEEASRGYVYLAGGTYTLTAGTDGIQAETVLLIDGGEYTIATGGGSANASVTSNGAVNASWGMWGRQAPGANQTSQQEGDAASAKGLKASGNLVLNGGTFTIDSSDDSIHSNACVIMRGGSFTIRSGDDGIHADDSLVIEDGTVQIDKSYEGLEGLNVTVSGGDIRITASDDGINSAGGSDTGMMGRPGQNSFGTASAGSDVYLKITGGTLWVDAGGDGLDSNGDLVVEGGVIYVSGASNDGNGALDYDGTADISGGTILATGMSGMAQGFSDSSSQCSILHNFGSTIPASQTVTLTDSSGNTLVSFTPSESFQSVAVSCPQLKQGESYTLTAGSQSETLTLSSTVTSNGGGGMMGGGGMQPGVRGR